MSEIEFGVDEQGEEIETPPPLTAEEKLLAAERETESKEGATPKPKAKGGKESQATVLVRLAEESGAEFFHTPDGEPYARIPVEGHWEIWPQRRKGFKNWLRRLYYEETGGAPNSQATQDALNVLHGIALFDGERHPVYTRVGEIGGSLYHDLANEEWEAIEVTPEGWRVVSDPPARFRRTRGMLPLPYPESGGSLEELRRWANAGSEDDFRLFVGWLVQAFRARGPFIGYSAHGEQGSAKSTRGRLARALLDPNSAPLRTRPRDERDLLIAATNSWVVTLDNLSYLPDWFSDALCRLATGGGLSTRELYTDSDEIIFDAQRPMFLNGIEEVAHRPDLLDRLLLAQLPRISDEHRKPEDELWAEFEEARPRLYGALLDAAACALRNLDSVRLPRHPRMADATRWVTAAEPALSWQPGTFLAAYEGNRAEADELALEASPLGQHVRDLAQVGFEGTTTELLKQLGELAGEETTRRRSWPKSGRALSGALRRLAPTLRANGVEVSFGRETTGKKRRLVLLRAVVQAPVTRVTRVTAGSEAASDAGWGGDASGDVSAPGDASGDAGDAAVTREREARVTGQSPLPTRPRDTPEGGGDSGDAAEHRRSEGVPGDAGDGRVPGLSEKQIDRLLSALAEAHRAGWVTTAEALERERLYRASVYTPNAGGSK